MSEPTTDPIADVEVALGHSFADRSLLEDALTHCSFANEKPALARTDNDKLEFLGDAVLQWAISALLWRHFPDADSGELTRRRADLVCAEGLDRVARLVGVDQGLRLGKGEERSGGRDKPRLLSSAFEACVGAVFLDGGSDAVIALCDRLFADGLQAQAPGERDFKTRLQEALQQSGRPLPRYRIDAVDGPDHAREFTVSALVAGQVVATGRGRSKLEAEQQAANEALAQLEST